MIYFYLTDKQTDEDKKLEAALKFVILYKEISEPNRVLSDRFKPYQIQPEACLTQALIDAQRRSREASVGQPENESSTRMKRSADDEPPAIPEQSTDQREISPDSPTSTNASLRLSTLGGDCSLIDRGTSERAASMTNNNAEDSLCVHESTGMPLPLEGIDNDGDDGDSGLNALDHELDNELLPDSPQSWIQPHYLDPALIDQDREPGAADELFGIVGPVTPGHPTVRHLSPAEVPTPTPLPGINWPRVRSQTARGTRPGTKLSAGGSKPTDSETSTPPPSSLLLLTRLSKRKASTRLPISSSQLAQPPRRRNGKTKKLTGQQNLGLLPATKTNLPVKRAKEGALRNEFIVVQHPMSGASIIPQHGVRQLETQRKIIKSFEDEDPSIPVRCGYGSNEPFDVYYVKIHPHAMFRQSNKDVVERLCRQYWNHIPFNLSDYNLLKTFQWFETDLGEIHQQKPNVSDVLDLARKFHDEAQKADHFAGYRKILAILIYRIFQFYAESPIEV
ncbi:hypothetical protein LTR46_011830 [Exophiala xenobiotica]|nr:hypothetical protein LTR46_011830 [Exophiala xenobiotica]